MILQHHPHHSSSSSSSSVSSVTLEEPFLFQLHSHSPIHHVQFPGSAVEEVIATTSAIQQELQRMTSKPIDIHSSSTNNQRQHNHTAPSAFQMPHSPQTWAHTMSIVDNRPMGAAHPMESSEEEKPRQKVCPIKSPTISKVPRNDLNAYRERILNEAMRRRVQEAMEQESDKENAPCFHLESTSENAQKLSCSEMFSELDDGIASCDEESEADDRTVPDSSCMWDNDEEALMPAFHSVADIIGYAKVVRAQRNEALGKLNNQIQQLTVLRMEMEQTMKTNSSSFQFEPMSHN